MDTTRVKGHKGTQLANGCHETDTDLAFATQIQDGQYKCQGPGEPITRFLYPSLPHPTLEGVDPEIPQPSVVLHV